MSAADGVSNRRIYRPLSAGTNTPTVAKTPPTASEAVTAKPDPAQQLAVDEAHGGGNSAYEVSKVRSCHCAIAAAAAAALWQRPSNRNLVMRHRLLLAVLSLGYQNLSPTSLPMH